MTEPRYKLIFPDPPPHPFSHVFDVIDEPGVVRKWAQRAWKQPVIDWLTERFGEGAVSTPGHPCYDIASYAPGRDSVAVAWSMDIVGAVAFQAENHAVEFRLRWCG
jgi:hypothetical protein